MAWTIFACVCCLVFVRRVDWRGPSRTFREDQVEGVDRGRDRVGFRARCRRNAAGSGPRTPMPSAGIRRRWGGSGARRTGCGRRRQPRRFRSRCTSAQSVPSSPWRPSCPRCQACRGRVLCVELWDNCSLRVFGYNLIQNDTPLTIEEAIKTRGGPLSPAFARFVRHLPSPAPAPVPPK